MLLSIAGFDPTAGAGVTADIKVFEYFRFAGMGIITAVTVQNTRAVAEVHPLPPRLLEEQYRALVDDVGIQGIKIGMLGSKHNIEVIARIISQHRTPIVVDPVFRSGTGTWLIEKQAVPAYLRSLEDKVTVITPNREEAALITGRPVTSLDEMDQAAGDIFQRYRIPVLITGGDLPGQPLDFFFDGSTRSTFRHERLSQKVHGTGCFLSSCLLCLLAERKSLVEACRTAVKMTHSAIRRSISVGRGQNLISIIHNRPLES